MLAIQAAVHGTQSLQPILIIISILAVLFWRAILKIILMFLLIGILISIVAGAAALMPMLQHVIK